jgi:xanthine/CO dehydrogenase XdhC/CoxF family maturation factor
MKDVLERITDWRSGSKSIAVATVVKTERSAPREPGAVMAVSEDGEVAGSVSGGCVEPAVYEEATQVLESGIPKLLTYGIADDVAFEVGLTCGGTIHIFVERLDW